MHLYLKCNRPQKQRSVVQIVLVKIETRHEEKTETRVPARVAPVEFHAREYAVFTY